MKDVSGHTPVLLNEVIQYLNLGEGKIYVDATLDGGGHARAVLNQWPGVKVVGIELDPIELEEFKKNNPEILNKITLVNDSYVNMGTITDRLGIRPDAILMDLGLSSWHYASSGRGFSFQKDELLDMRFNPQLSGPTAADIVNRSDKDEIERMLIEYGEEQFASSIAEGIIRARKDKAIVRVPDLVEIIKSSVPAWYRSRKINPATKTFQALRIAVNGELDNVKTGVEKAIEVLSPGGRLLVISFHGLEDKIVRELFKKYAKEGVIKWVTRATVKPGWPEIKENPRARSAKLKIIEKI